MKRFVFPLLVAAAVFPIFAAAQRPQQGAPTKQVSVFRVGRTMEDVQLEFGPPSRYWMDGHYYDHLPSIAYGARLWDVYSRRTGRNEYEIRIAYDIDASASRLHPTLRVGDIKFFLDRAVPMKDAMEDIPEVAIACLPGCRILVDVMFGNFVWLSAEDGSGIVVSGCLEDPATGKLVKLAPPEIVVSTIDIGAIKEPLRPPLVKDSGSVWKPSPPPPGVVR